MVVPIALSFVWRSLLVTGLDSKKENTLVVHWLQSRKVRGSDRVESFMLIWGGGNGQYTSRFLQKVYRCVHRFLITRGGMRQALIFGCSSNDA